MLKTVYSTKKVSVNGNDCYISVVSNVCHPARPVFSEGHENSY